MPLWLTEYDHVKLYRPRGTPYASGRGATINSAVERAFAAFAIEFGREVEQEQAVVEVVGSTAMWDASVFELPEESEEW